MQRRLVPLLFLLFGVAAWAAPPVSTGNAFQTPSGNIACVTSPPGEPLSLRCDLAVNEAKPPKRPRHCELDWGNAFALGETGRATRLCYGDTAAGEHPVLAYGATWKRGGVECVSSEKGLRCVNRDGHGFDLSRRKQRLF